MSWVVPYIGGGAACRRLGRLQEAARITYPVFVENPAQCRQFAVYRPIRLSTFLPARRHRISSKRVKAVYGTRDLRHVSDTATLSVFIGERQARRLLPNIVAKSAVVIHAYGR